MIKGRKSVTFLIVILIMITTSSIFANENIKSVQQSKLIGKNRYETAIKVSNEGWSIANNVILVNSNALSDALTVTPLAKAKNAPILLIEKNSIPQETIKEVKRLGAKYITLVGSEGVISSNVENQLKKDGYNVNRIGGNDRIQTSMNVANELEKVVYFKKIAVVNGYKGLVDATSIAAAAGKNNMPILYTNGSNLNGIKRFIENNAETVYIVGSDSVVSKNIEKELKNAVNNVRRIGGKDRKDTNAKVINEFYSDINISNIYVSKDGSSNQSELVDGLSVGVLAAKNYSPVLLANNGLSQSQKYLLKSKNVKSVVQVGGGLNEKSFIEATNILKNPPKEVTDSLSNLEKSKMENFLEIFLEDYVRLLDYDRNDNIDKGKLLEFAFNSIGYDGGVEQIEGSVEWEQFMDKRTLKLDIIKKYINELFGISFDMKSGDKYYFEDSLGRTNTFTLQNNKVMRYGGFEERGGCAYIASIDKIYSLGINEYIVYFDEYWTHDFETMEFDGKLKAVIKKISNEKYNLIRINENII